MLAVVLVTVWKGYPFIMIMLLAGLQSIPLNLYKAAELDGASKLRQFIHITIPSLKSILLIGLILSSIWWFKHFTMTWLLTAGESGTNVLNIDIYKTSFSYFRFGEAAAMSVVIFFICLLLGITYRKTIKDD